jgi:tRNA uridine 5-carboxymethylaminomethyl modification enzyme
LTTQGREFGLVDDPRWDFFQHKRDAVKEEFARLSAAVVHPVQVDAGLLAKLGQPLLREAHAIELLRRPGVAYEDLRGVAPGNGEPCGVWRGDDRLVEQVALQVEVQAKYSGYLKRQTDEIDRQRHNEGLQLPPDIDYAEVGGLSNEARQCLTDVRPATLGQAARIPGLTPSAVSLLLVHLKKRHHAA